MWHKKRLARQLGLLTTLFVVMVFMRQETAVSSPKPVEVEYVTTQQTFPLDSTVLSPIWNSSIQQWANDIQILSEFYGIHPDLIAAVIREESNGQPSGVSLLGAVGLMGVMPSGPGLEWRPSTEELLQPSINLRWGVQILADVVRQSGGDLGAALAAYNGGWAEVDQNVPQNYAAAVLDNYGRAIAARSGISPDIADQWTIAIELTRGNVTNESLLVLGDQPVSGIWKYGEHTIYDYIDQSGRAYHIRGYAVPVALVVPPDQLTGSGTFGDGTSVEAELEFRQGETNEKISNRNPRIILACLPSLNRLRGHVSTRWFAPTDCPDWHR
ncbi:MAG: transglycosylase SLT domain-containing protein [Chloroflexota bacterium]